MIDYVCLKSTLGGNKCKVGKSILQNRRQKVKKLMNHKSKI